MCNWRRWVWPGILATVILTALAMFFNSTNIENDLTAKANSALQVEHPWASVALDGRDLTLQGIAPSDEAAAAALITSDNAYDVRTVKNATTLPAIASPYPFKAIKSDSGVTLTGNYPSEAVRAQIVAAAETSMPGVAVTDELTLSRGAPAGYAALAGFGLSQLGNLTSGEASLSDLDYTIKGTTADSAAYESEISKANGTLPEGGKLAMVDISAPTKSPYTWNAVKSADGNITLSGFAPSFDAREATAAAAAAENPGATINNELQIATGAPESYGALTQFGLGQLNDLTSGNVALVDDQYAINGIAKSSQNFEQATAAANGELPEGGKLASAAITPPSADGAYNWAATKSPDGAITLTGLMPTAQERDRIADRAAEVNPGATINNQMEIAAGAPEGFADNAYYSLGYLPRFTAGTSTLSNADLTIQGRAIDGNNFDAAKSLDSGVGEGVSLTSDIKLPDADGTYQIVATKAVDSVTLTGFAPSTASKSAIATAAGELGLTVNDQIVVAAGAPEGVDWTQAGSFAVNGLKDVSTGKAMLSQTDLSIDADTVSGEKYTMANAMWDADLPAGTELANKAIRLPTVSPYLWKAQKRPNGSIVLSGLVPSADARSAMEKAVADKNVGVEITNNLQLAAGTPEGYADLTAFGIEQLDDLTSGTALIKDSGYEIVGVAKTSASFETAKAAANGTLPGNGTLTREAISPPSSKSYQLTVSKSSDAVILNGVAPTLEARDQIAAAAESLGIPVTNNIELATGAPEGIDWGAAGAFTVKGLQDVSKGSSSLIVDKLSVDADTLTLGKYGSANKAWDGDLPAGTSIISKDIRLPRVSPYVWKAENTNRVAISGYVPSKDVQGKTVAQAKGLFGTAKQVIDNQQLAGGEPEGFETATSVGLIAIQELENGMAQINGTELTVSGVAKTDADKAKIENNVRTGVAAGFKGIPNITVKPKPKPAPKPEPKPAPKPVVQAPSCQEKVNLALKDNKIGFETNKAIINSDSFGLLDGIATAVQGCPDASIEVGGHTDSRGSSQYNANLSERRAQAVVDYLSAKGVSQNKMTARGFGEDNPIASNDTEEGRAQNRRIELKISQ